MQTLDRQTILVLAMTQASRGGITSLTFQGMATALDIPPEALKKHYPNSSSLSVAVVAESSRRLLSTLETAVSTAGNDIPVMASAYLMFAQNEPFLFSLSQEHLTRAMKGAHDVPLWGFILSRVRMHYLNDAAVNAAFALLSFLNGLAALCSQQVVKADTTSQVLSLGVQAWLMAADRS